MADKYVNPADVAKIRDWAKELVAAEGGGNMIITVTQEGTAFVADKTYAEITEAMQGGKVPYLVATISENKFIFIVDGVKSDGSINFVCTYGNISQTSTYAGFLFIVISADDTIDLRLYDVSEQIELDPKLYRVELSQEETTYSINRAYSEISNAVNEGRLPALYFKNNFIGVAARDYGDGNFVFVCMRPEPQKLNSSKSVPYFEWYIIHNDDTVERTIFNLPDTWEQIVQIIRGSYTYDEGNWTYRINYVDNSFDAWYKAAGVTITITASSGNLYRSESRALTLPDAITSNYTVDILDATVNASHANYPAWGMLASINSNGINYYAMSGSSRNVSPNYIVTAHVFGRLAGI